MSKLKQPITNQSAAGQIAEIANLNWPGFKNAETVARLKKLLDVKELDYLLELVKDKSVKDARNIVMARAPKLFDL